MSIAEHLNGFDSDSLRRALTKCCAANRWVEAMIGARPLADDEQVRRAAAENWWKLDRADWLEAFAAHPKIGDVDSLRAKFAGTRAWAGSEQSGVADASEATLLR